MEWSSLVFNLKTAVKYILVATEGQNLIKMFIWINFISCVSGHNETDR